jgi:hypothetical protein
MQKNTPFYYRPEGNTADEGYSMGIFTITAGIKQGQLLYSFWNNKIQYIT